VFDTIDKQDIAEGAVEKSEESRKLTKIMMDTWIAFARTGDPNHAGIPNWPCYDLERRFIMNLEIEPKSIETKDDPLREAWKHIF
jgi:para-nitrobenzyl esterase